MLKFVKRKKGFTLVELIVTIAIIAILSTMVGLSVNFFIKQANIKTQFTTIETAIKTCNAIYLEANLGYSGINVSDLTEYQDKIGSFVKEANNVTGSTVNPDLNNAANNSMFIYYKYDKDYDGGDDEKAQPKYYLYEIYYVIDGNVWAFKYQAKKITLNGSNYN